MKRTIFQVILILLLVSFCLTGFFLARHILQLPFRSTNDALHKKEAAFNLDFLIPSGTHIDEIITIGEVIKIRTRKEASFYEKMLHTFSELIPVRYRYLANLILFFFWYLVFMTFLRVFTFMGYGRAFRGSLFLGGSAYYFMPDFSPGKSDDILFVGVALLIIIIRAYLNHRKKVQCVTDISKPIHS